MFQCFHGTKHIGFPGDVNTDQYRIGVRDVFLEMFSDAYTFWSFSQHFTMYYLDGQSVGLLQQHTKRRPNITTGTTDTSVIFFYISMHLSNESFQN